VTIDKADLVERLGQLPAGTVDTIRGGLQLLFDRVTSPCARFLRHWFTQRKPASSIWRL